MTTILQERQGLERVGHRLRRREEAGFRRSYTDTRSVVEPAETQHVHITITNPSSYASDDAHARAIEAIGISRFPSTGVSYNRLVMRSGRAYEGQPIGRRGAHTVNDFRRATCSTTGCPGRGGSLRAPSWNNNYTGRAYVICQNVNDSVTDAQVDSLARCMAADRLAGFVKKSARIHGHRCCSSKSCPGNKMWSRMHELNEKINYYVRNGLGTAPKPPTPPTPKPPPEDEMKLGIVSEYGSTQFVFIDLNNNVQKISEGTFRSMKANTASYEYRLLSNAYTNQAIALQQLREARQRQVLWVETTVSRGDEQRPVIQEVADILTGVKTLVAQIPPAEARQLRTAIQRLEDVGAAVGMPTEIEEYAQFPDPEPDDAPVHVLED